MRYAHHHHVRKTLLLQNSATNIFTSNWTNLHALKSFNGQQCQTYKHSWGKGGGGGIKMQFSQ
jgi:formylmethanofuran dehydrogenase subunit A